MANTNKLILIAASLGMALNPAIASAEDVGSFLSLRHAFYHSDDAAVAQFVERELRKKPDDTRMLEQAIISDVFYDDLPSAFERVEQLKDLGYENLYTNLAELGYHIQRNEFGEAADIIDQSDALSFFSAALMRAWQAANDGDNEQAQEILVRAATNDPDTAPLYDYQRALILAYGGDYAAGAQILDGDTEALYLSNDSFYTHVVMKILADDPTWQSLVNETYGERENWTYLVSQFVEQALDGKIPETTSFASPQNAIGEHLRFALSTAGEDDTDSYIQRFFVTLLPAIAPDHDGLVANALAYFDRSDEDDDLLLYADKIDDGSPYRLLRDNYASDHNFFLDNVSEAQKIVDRAPETTFDTFAYKANSYRILSDFERSVEYYDKAIGVTGETPNSWNLFYGRAIAEDRLNDWPSARASMEKALELSPDNPEVLNYLGYSLVDRNEDVERGLELINKAVDIAPERGHILDSLGWAYYRLGRYEEALEPLEQSSFLIPTEPVVYSHLGDLYWHLGRKREARFMWERALVFITEDTIDTSVEEIQMRLDTGAPPKT